MGIEIALIKKHESSLYYLVNDYKDVFVQIPYSFIKLRLVVNVR